MCEGQPVVPFNGTAYQQFLTTTFNITAVGGEINYARESAGAMGCMVFRGAC